jgi:ABC-type branched-subunit amino acid transport system ATPase component
MLEIKNLTVSYGAISALHGISLSVPAGSIVTLIGSNGAGKTTTLKTISGLLKPKSGEIIYDGKNISGLPPHEIVKRGLSHVPEGRMIFANLTVLENLQMGAYLVRDKKVRPARAGICLRHVSATARNASSRSPARFRRRAADAGDWPRADGAAEISDAGRAVARPRAAAGENDF